MKLSLFLLIFAALIVVNSSFAGVGGISGGSKMITVEVCDMDVPGLCRTIRYLDRFTEQDKENAANQKSDCLMSVGEALYVPCDDKKTYEIPKFLKKLNEVFGGTTAPPNIDSPN